VWTSVRPPGCILRDQLPIANWGYSSTTLRRYPCILTCLTGNISGNFAFYGTGLSAPAVIRAAL